MEVIALLIVNFPVLCKPIRIIIIIVLIKIYVFTSNNINRILRLIKTTNYKNRFPAKIVITKLILKCMQSFLYFGILVLLICNYVYYTRSELVSFSEFSACSGIPAAHWIL